MPLLEVSELKTYYSTLSGTVHAVDGISFDLERGETLGLAGESGCGKTTAALSVMRLLPNNAYIAGGTVIFDGNDLLRASLKDIRRIRWKRISIIFQGALNALNPLLPIGHQISDAIITHEEVDKSKASDRASELLEKVGIRASLSKEYPHELSGGMKQRVMIAMALACNPDLVIADEPSSSLDVMVQAQIMDLIKETQRSRNLSMILITHDLSILAETCDKLAVMYAGKVVEYANVKSFYKRPAHPYAQGLLKAFPNITKLQSKREVPPFIPGAPPDLSKPPPGCRFHLRCPLAQKLCIEQVPELREIEKGHYAACHFA